MKLGTENKKKTMWAAGLGVVAVLVAVYEFSSISGPSSTPLASAPVSISPIPRASTHAGSKSDKKAAALTDTLDPTLQLQLLQISEETKYEGKGRNIFVSQAEEVKIETPKSSGVIAEAPKVWTPPPVPPPPPIPLKFFGFASKPGEPKRIFLSKEQDVFIAGEGEIIDRRYKVMRISPTSVEVQDLVNSGPPQSIPLTQNL